MSLGKIVGVGASAGGIEALRQLFRQLRPDCGLAIVVVLHLPPGGDATLAPILARDSILPVHTAVDGEVLQPGHVHVAPPGAVLTVAGGRVVLRPSMTLNSDDVLPVDALFLSLAENYGADAVGVLLSGLGHDGTLGAEAIQAAGGLTIGQGPGAGGPLFADMPGNAIAAASIDQILPAEEIAGYLARLAGPALSKGTQEGPPSEEEELALAAEHDAICDILRRETEHDFSGYKTMTFFRRVRRRVRILGMNSLAEYVEHLRQDAGEARALRQDLLISVTAFFRDAEVFDSLESDCIPRLFEGRSAQDTIRVWVPACASGEEAFSLAILLQEEADRRPGGPQWQVFATDVDESALKTARQGQYDRTQLASVSLQRRERFFEPSGAGFVVRQALRERCLFSVHNLLQEPPFSRIDLISCRNLLIYLKSSQQADVFPIFYFALRPGGYLLLGGAESASNYSDLFTPADRFNNLYQRRSHAVISPRLPNFRISAPRSNARGAGANRMAGAAPTPRQLGEAVVLARFAPPYVVVNRDGEVLHFSANTNNHLTQPPGQPTRNLFALAPLSLSSGLRETFQEALRTGGSVTSTTAGLAITVTRVPGSDAADPLLLVIFVEVPPPAAAEPGAAAGEAGASPASARELEEAQQRLRAMQEEQKAAIAAQRAITQELALMNEELQSANGELEVSHEEMQSLNEELIAINRDLRSKVEELDRSYADQRNLFEVTDLATIILDANLAIRDFTPAGKRLLKLGNSDRGRPFASMAQKLEGVGVVMNVHEAAAGRVVPEQQVTVEGQDGRYLLRMLPYRTAAGETDGVLVTLVDITQLLDAREEQERQHVRVVSAEAARAELDLTLSVAPLAVFRGHMESNGAVARKYVSRNIEKLTGLPPSQQGQIPFVDGDSHDPGAGGLMERQKVLERSRCLLRDGEWDGEESIQRTDGTLLWLRSSFRLLNRLPDGSADFVGYFADATRERQLRALAAGQDRLASLGEMSAGLGHEINQPLQAIILAAELGQMTALHASAGETDAAFGQILSQAVRMGEIIQHLRTFAKGGAPSEPMRPIELRAAVDGALVLIGGTLRASGISVDVRLDEAASVVQGTLVAIEHVLTNLLLNARDALDAKPPGQPRWIQLTSRPGVRAGEIQLCVADNGGGIVPAILSRLFEPFQTSKGPDHGTGLGLSICHGLLRSMGGSIEGHNCGEGAVFTMNFVAATGA